MFFVLIPSYGKRAQKLRMVADLFWQEVLELLSTFSHPVLFSFGTGV